jgi:hypothetical protein
MTVGGITSFGTIAAMEPAAERRDDLDRRQVLTGPVIAAMEPAAERRDDGSPNSRRLTCGNTHPCERPGKHPPAIPAMELSKSRKHRLTCMRATPGIRPTTSSLASRQPTMRRAKDTNPGTLTRSPRQTTAVSHGDQGTGSGTSPRQTRDLPPSRYPPTPSSAPRYRRASRSSPGPTDHRRTPNTESASRSLPCTPRSTATAAHHGCRTPPGTAAAP